MIRNSRTNYGIVAQAFHWLTALLILIMAITGLVMEDMVLGPSKIAWYGFHKALGFSLLVLVICRLIWRFCNKAPALPDHLPAREKLLASSVHFSLYLLMLAMPISGLLMSWASGFPVNIFGLFTLPNLIAANPDLQKFFKAFHEITIFILLALIALHIFGGLRHHLYYKDNVLKRMLKIA